MKIVIISAVFPPEPIVSAKTSYSLAVGLVHRKHLVSVITNFPNRPAGKIYKGYKRSLYSTENNTAEFRLVRCFSFLSKDSSSLSRMMENISFGLTSSLYLLFCQRPDAVYSNSWPVFATGLTCLVCNVRQIPLVINVQDMYPESLAIQGRIQQYQWLYRFLFSIDKWIAKHAKEVIVLSKSFAQIYIRTRQVDSEKIHIIPNWVDQDSVTQMKKGDYRNEKGIPLDAFVIVYGGNIGKAAGVETIIKAMARLNNNKNIFLVIAGSGSELSTCQKLASNIKNVCIVFHNPWEPEETSKVLAAADVLILPTQGTQSLASVPSKLLSYMLAARPVFAIVLPESDTAQVINDAGCGWVVSPDNVNQLAEKIKELSTTPLNVLEKMGLLGRAYALNNFTTEVSLPKIIEIINKY